MVNKPDSEVSPEVLSERRYWEGYTKSEAERAGIDTRGCVGGAILHLMVEEIERLQRSAKGWEETAALETRNKLDREAELERLQVALESAKRSFTNLDHLILNCTIEDLRAMAGRGLVKDAAFNAGAALAAQDESEGNET